MTNPICLPASATVAVAAAAMREADIGDVMVHDDGRVCGIVTDRDIVVRAVADHLAPDEVTIGEICSRELAALSPADSVDDAVRVMRDRALRRLPVMDGDRPVGIVSLGDLALVRDPGSALGTIRGAAPNT